jgi:hypothetical protein
MSAVAANPIANAVFEQEMYNLHLSLGDKCTYGQWHKEDPTKPLREMIRHMTRIREEAEEEAAKRAAEDWAYEAEQLAAVEAAEEAESNVMPCLYCDEPVPYGVCDPCQHAMDEYGAIQCVHCEAGWTTRKTPPCVKCHPRYIADFRAAEAAAIAPAPVAPAATESTSDDEDMGWYKAKKAEWAAYAAALEEESKRPAPEEGDE